jgi:hypothetical membrane protein
MRPSSRGFRSLWVGGVVGPTAFVLAWTISGFTNDSELSAIHDAISELAAVDVNTRWLMTVGFVTFGVGVGAFAVAVMWIIDTLTALALGAAAASTLAVAALPLGVSDTVDTLHGVAAGIGYVTLAFAPIAAYGPLRRMGRARLAAAGSIVALVAALCLTASLTSGPTGVFQRVGLTILDIWIVVVATLIAVRDLPRSLAD